MVRDINTLIVGESKYSEIEKGYTINPERAKIYKWMEVVDRIYKDKEIIIVRKNKTSIRVIMEKVQEIHYK